MQCNMCFSINKVGFSKLKKKTCRRSCGFTASFSLRIREQCCALQMVPQPSGTCDMFQKAVGKERRAKRPPTPKKSIQKWEQQGGFGWRSALSTYVSYLAQGYWHCLQNSIALHLIIWALLSPLSFAQRRRLNTSEFYWKFAYISEKLLTTQLIH